MNYQRLGTVTECSLLAWVFMALVASTAFGFTIPGFSKSQNVVSVNGLVKIPVATVSDESSHFYNYHDGCKKISFFLIKKFDGSFHAAFDFCHTCFADKKGFFQDGDSMVCRSCGKRYSMKFLGIMHSDECNPAYLPCFVEEGNVVIRAADISKAAKYF